MSKEVKITVPEGYEIDRENSTFECIKFKKKALTYENVAKELFCGKETYYISTDGRIKSQRIAVAFAEPNNATNNRQLERLLAYNKLMNVAEYLNSQALDWNDRSNGRWIITYDHTCKTLGVGCHRSIQSSNVYFDSIEHAKQAIEILGESVVKAALGVFE